MNDDEFNKQPSHEAGQTFQSENGSSVPAEAKPQSVFPDIPEHKPTEEAQNYSPQNTQSTPFPSSSIPLSQPKEPWWQKKLFVALAGLAVFIVGVAAGIALQALVIDKPSTIEKIIDAQYKALYGEDYEQIIEDELNNEISSYEETGQDFERKTDINALHTQYEVYFNDNGFYPTEKEAVDTSNFPGLDIEALIDPDGQALNQDGGDYTYTPSDCNDEGCESYVLTAQLESDPWTHTKLSLN